MPGTPYLLQLKLMKVLNVAHTSVLFRVVKSETTLRLADQSQFANIVEVLMTCFCNRC